MSDDKLVQELEEATALMEQESKKELAPLTEQVIESQPEDTSNDPFLEQAIKDGYNPNYDGVDKKSPEQFIKDGSFYKKIKEQKKQITELKDAFREVSRQMKKSERVGYEKAYHELQAQKTAAIEIGDVAKVYDIDKEMDVVKEELNKPDESVIEKPVQPHQAAINFKETNAAWFGKYDNSKSMTEEEKENLEMTETALVYDNYLGEQIHKGVANYTPEQCIQMVQERIKKYYPHRFENPKKSEPMTVGKPSMTDSISKSTLTSRMTERQKEMHKMYSSIDSSFGSLDDYAKHLDSINELKKN